MSNSNRNIGLTKRYRAERRFRIAGFSAIIIGLTFLVLLLSSIVMRGYGAFWQSVIVLDITLQETVIDPQGQRTQNPDILMTADYPLLVRNALAQKLGVEPGDRAVNRDLTRFFSGRARVELRDRVVANPAIIGTVQPVTILASADIDQAFKGQINLNVPEKNRKISDRQIEWLNRLVAEGALYQQFNWDFLTLGGSSRAEASGLGVALIGSGIMMLVVLIIGVPIGVGAAIYLQEFAKKGRLSDFIEININNLAAVPSIVYGLLGLAVFINLFGMPRSAALVGGMVLMLMTLPTIVIATRAALGSVPPSIRAAALGLGASKVQMLFGHVLPLALPGILTGTIIGLARALGETAPLLLIGMVAFIVDKPASPLDPATALPVQIYMWAGEAERAFVERTSGGIIVLLVFLALMNLAAVLLRRKFERRW